MTYLQNAKDLANTTNEPCLIHACQDKEVCKCMIADSLGHDTERRRKIASSDNSQSIRKNVTQLVLLWKTIYIFRNFT